MIEFNKETGNYICMGQIVAQYAPNSMTSFSASGLTTILGYCFSADSLSGLLHCAIEKWQETDVDDDLLPKKALALEVLETALQDAYDMEDEYECEC